ncbi:MAG: hypothetical protein AABO58_16440 [Acidobacteriota bacterium]
MRFLRLFALSMVAVPLSAQLSWQGVWAGSTSQAGKTISITVDGTNHVMSVMLSGRATGTSCTSDFNQTTNFGSQQAVNAVNTDGSFTSSASIPDPGFTSFVITGTLVSTGLGSGSVTFTRNGIPGQPGAAGCTGSGTATFNLTRQGGPPGLPAAILAVVGSVQGAAFFRTGVQIHNPSGSSITGRFLYHPQGTSGTPNDVSMAYTLEPGQTTAYPDLLPAMGLSGLGSLDIVTSDPVPVMVARVFSDAGDAGTAGFTIDPVAPSAALQAGQSGVIILPPDLVKTRLNVGFRSLETGAAMTMTLRRSNSAVKGTLTKSLAANFFEQPSVAALLPGLFLEGSDTITFAITSGKVIIYGASTENKTQDPSLQYAKKAF